MDEQQKQERLLVERTAKTWLRTPYHHAARVKGHGVDCAQIIAAVFEEAGLVEHFEIEEYNQQWFLHRDEERYLEYVERHANRIEEKDALVGDLVIYQVGRLFAHGAIIVSPGWPRIVHAYRPARVVTEADGSIGDIGHRNRRFYRLKRWS